MGVAVHVIDWFPNRPVELSKHRVHHIGRGAGNEFYLPDYHASRIHAQIAWDGQRFVLRDMDSSNGTFVNGKRVTAKALTPGDEIHIGVHVLKFRTEDTAKIVEDYERKSKQVREWKTEVGLAASEGTLSGSINEADLSQIVQMLEAGRKTGRLHVTCVGASGSVYFKNGAIVAADFGSLAGHKLSDHEAIYTMVTLREGVFEFINEAVEIESRVKETTHALLMEAFRRLDEEGRDRSSQSSADTVRLQAIK